MVGISYFSFFLHHFLAFCGVTKGKFASFVNNNRFVKPVFHVISKKVSFVLILECLSQKTMFCWNYM